MSLYLDNLQDVKPLGDYINASRSLGKKCCTPCYPDLKFCFFSVLQKEFSTDCKLIERIEENQYNTYASAEWKNKKKHMFVGLSANGKPMRAKKTRRKNTATHFLPIPIP